MTGNLFFPQSRVVCQQPGERNFHSFYYLINGASDDKLSEHYGLKQKAKFYSFINQDDTQQITAASDKKNFSQVNDAMKVVGFDEQTVQTIWNIVASIIHLGNVKFEETETHDKCGINKYSMNNEIKIIAKLLNIDQTELVNALTTRILATGSKDIVAVNHTVKDAVYGRNAFAKVSLK